LQVRSMVARALERRAIHPEAVGRPVNRRRLHRRTLLRGIGGVAVGLPLLECMLDANGSKLAEAQELGLPQRYGIVFAGQAIGGDGWAKNMQRIDGESYE